MRTLFQSLQDLDLGQLRIIAELWGLDLPPAPALQYAQALAQAMLDPTAVAELMETLPGPARQALDCLAEQSWQVPLATFTRRFGPWRPMGPGRRDRQKPWRTDASPLEALWYRGLIGSAFVDSPTGPQELAFVPLELRPYLSGHSPAGAKPFGHSAPEPVAVQLASTVAADDATTLLAALRRRPPAGDWPQEKHRLALLPYLHQPQSLDLLTSLLLELGIITRQPVQPEPQAIHTLLDLPRPQIMAKLIDSWVHSGEWNDLAHVSSLTSASQDWPNDPLTTRSQVLSFVSQTPSGIWWDLGSFVQDVHLRMPAFQRPAGDFDAWYLRDSLSGSFLSGFEAWDRVEGAVLRFVLWGPLHWLGMVDLGAANAGSPATAFRLAPLAALLGDPTSCPALTEKRAAATLRSDGSITVPIDVPLALRYQIARFALWEGRSAQGYHYRLTPSSLQQGAEQGLRLEHVRAVLRQASGRPIPPALSQALARWSTHGTEGSLERLLVLRLHDPGLLKKLQQHRATAKLLGQTFGTTLVCVRDKDLKALIQAAARLGILLDVPEAEWQEQP